MIAPQEKYGETITSHKRVKNDNVTAERRKGVIISL